MSCLLYTSLYETESFSFYSRKAFDAIRLPAQSPLRSPVVIANPLGEDTSVMRTTALPSIMDIVARNYNARAAECAVFEDATIYLPQGGPDELPREVETVVMAAYGPAWIFLP